MRSGQAKKILNRLNNECTIDKWKQSPFRRDMMANVRAVFGIDSVHENTFWAYYNKPDISQSELDDIKCHLDNYINDVGNGAFLKDKNWISGISNKEIIAYVSTIMAVLWLFGYIVGAYDNPKSVLWKMFKEKSGLPPNAEKASK